MKTIYEREQEGNLTDDEKERFALVKDFFKDDIPLIIQELQIAAATVTISVKLPATINMNKDNFFIPSVDGKEVGTFASDILNEMDADGVVELKGSGRASFKFDLKVAAFCPHITDENKTPSIETVLSGLLQ